MKIKSLLLILSCHYLLSACSGIATGSAELTGLSLLHDRRTSEVIMSDEGIELNASIALNSDGAIRRNSHFNVTAYNGLVLITGETLNAALRSKIVSLVRVIPDVKLIQNELKIADLSSLSSRTSDSFVTTKIKSALSDVKNLPGFDATRIKVVTENSVVYLLGLVHKNEGHTATEIARRTRDVEKVVQVFEYIE